MDEIKYIERPYISGAWGVSARRRGGGDTGEEDSEQRGSCQGGRLLDGTEVGREGKPWQAMPQMKGLKELKLPVGNEVL